MDNSNDTFSVLYIIGNGFDLCHKLETKYENFSKYVKQHDTELAYYLASYLDAVDLWGDFENNLAKFNPLFALGDNEELLPDEDTEHDGDKYVLPDQAERIVDILTRKLRCTLRNWILSVDLNAKCRFDFLQKAYFLSFNYTRTMEKLYNIDDVYHIHGIAKPSRLAHGEQDDSCIILGHRSSSEIKVNNSRLKGFDQYYAWNEADEKINTYWKKSIKNVTAIIDNSKSFFERIHSVDSVVVIGHSLSDVDIEYFKVIAKSINKHPQWQITHFGDKEKEIIQQRAKKFCPDISAVKFIDLDINFDIMKLPQC